MSDNTATTISAHAGLVRLLRLAAHLRKPEEDRLHRFSFENLRADERGCMPAVGVTRHGIANCGSIGCAIGETPLLWPREIRFEPIGLFSAYDLNYSGTPVTYITAAVMLFNISHQDARELFIPAYERPWMQNTKLDATAHPTEVADSIVAYVSWVRAGRQNTEGYDE